MKKNFPVTQQETGFPETVELISQTDLKGIITTANQEFVDISGFSREELYGTSHNIVRHPDMPSAAFEDLWGCLKSGKHWMGIVKNCCKNGDHYWVDAYVTPVFENGKVCSYESVRVKPSQERVDRAVKVYKRIEAGKTPRNALSRLSYFNRLFIGMSISFLFVLGVVLLFSGIQLQIAALAMGASLVASWVTTTILYKPVKLALAEAKRTVDNPLITH